MKAPIKVLFVCMGNICRSPSAEGVFRGLVEAHGLEEMIEIDSAGTHGYHVGSAPDPRSTEAALKRGIDIRKQKARKVQPEDFYEYDYILAMDDKNHFELQEACPPSELKKLYRFLDFAPSVKTREVPDPYYGGPNGFETVLDLIELASQGLLEEIQKSLEAQNT
ncbi:MAG: low molecular weight phosphotyrosine protein phosphatase [Cyanobacteria bacterium]|nr:low molecular weight phosphotyrosine protein phosphatase [Cyanobacteriota bacterium]